MQLGAAVTQFPICPACGREGRTYGPFDWNCAHCRAVIELVEETNEAGEKISHWAIKHPPNEGVLEALERGENPFVHVTPRIDPYASAKALAEQRRATFAEDAEPVTLAALAKDLGASCGQLVELGQRMGLFDEGKGGPRTQLDYNQLTQLRNMWGVAGLTQRQQRVDESEPAEDVPEIVPAEDELVEAEA